MEALQFDPHSKNLSLVKADIPTITEVDEVVVKVMYAGVCGTDLHIMSGAFPCRDGPFIPGHEFCGIVSSIGSEVKHVKPGDRVVVDPNTDCGTCSFCTSGKYHRCPISGVTTVIGIFFNGGWAQYCKAPARQIQLIPNSITLQQAALCEPLSCISHGWDRVAPLSIGSAVLVSGAGIIGNLWTAILHHSGHRNVVVSEPSQPRRSLNQKLKTGYKCYSPEEIKTLKAENPKWGVDFCVDCSGNSMAIEQGLSLLRTGGKLCVFGVASPDSRIKVSPFEIYKKELTIVGALLNPFSFPSALNLIEAMGSRYLDYEKLGIKVYSLEQYQEAFVALKNGTISKAMFKLFPDTD